MKKNVLCLDAGFANCGYAVVQLPGEKIIESGTIETKAAPKKQKVRVADDSFRRCQESFRELSAVAAKYSVAGLIVELPNGAAKGSRAVSCMGMASAIVACLVEVHGLAVECVTPVEVKRIAKGKGAVTKDEVAAVVAAHFKADAEELGEHCCDALGAYLSARDGQVVRLLKQQSGG